MLAALKTEMAQVWGGVVGISLTGLMIGKLWFLSIDHKKPTTLTPQWEAATAKYRAAQNQDPIRLA